MTVFCSWSGGKESSLALDATLQNGTEVDYLITMFPSKNSKLGHGLPPKFYKLQANSIGIELEGKETNWDEYEDKISKIIKSIKPEKGVFGDVYLEDHKKWVENKGKELNFEPTEPLWGKDPEKLFLKYLDRGFEGIIVKIDPKKISEEWLGKKLDKGFLQYTKEKNICPIGENGEYHTATLNGPIFEREIEIEVNENKKYGESLIVNVNNFELV